MWVLLGTIALFLGLDALTSTAWFDMMGRAFTPAGRAQTLTINQFLGALGGIGSGFIVQWVLGSDRWPFPAQLRCAAHRRICVLPSCHSSPCSSSKSA